jgi:2,4-dienoyl-CoA reductase-like NADH-dependent reductase (Old Yellow Enzyme family)/thioredoxin reductase
LFKRLFEPLSLGPIILPNRIVMPALGTNFATSQGEVTPRLIHHYQARAAGGAGLIIVEGTAVHQTGRGFLYQLSIDRDELIPSLKDLAAAVHEAGARIFIQLHHGGRNTNSRISGTQPWGPSAVPSPVGTETPKEMTQEEIRKMVRAFLEGARRAREAAFDGIELHGAHEYLLSQFLSPYSNFRKDEYGGNLENRLRICREIIEGIRQEQGPDFLISFRISGEEYVSRGMHIQESLKAAQALAGYGVDLLNVSGGVYETPHLIIPPLSFPQGVHIAFAETMKNALSLPVIGVGRILHPEFAEKILEAGQADLIALGRALIADPEWPKKARNGKSRGIRTCVGCNQGCIDFLMAERPITCLYNPTVGLDKEFDLAKAEKPAMVVVMGAGPAGLEAATRLEQWGHQVYLFEKDKRIGGQVNLAMMTPTKGEFQEVISYYEQKLEPSTIQLFLNTRPSIETILALEPDFVIVATGSVPIDPDIPGIQGSEVFTVQAALCQPEKVGEKVVVLGGGNAGCEVADYLSRMGRKVTLLEMGNRIARDIGPARRYLLTRRLRENKVKNLIRCRIKSLSPGQVTYIREEKDGHRSLRVLNGIDTFVNALGVKSNDIMAGPLKEKGIQVIVIGDALSPGKILDAVAEGAQVAREIHQKVSLALKNKDNKKT